MLDFRTLSLLANATAAITRSCVAATTNTWATSACRGLALWTEMMGTESRRDAPAWQQPEAAPHALGATRPSVANWMSTPQLHAWSSWPWLHGSVRPAWTPAIWPGPTFSLWMTWTSVPMWIGHQDAMGRPADAVMPATEPAGFSSYRSGGGHAVAQIAAPATELVELTATAVLNPMRTMLAAWRAALGV